MFEVYYNCERCGEQVETHEANFIQGTMFQGSLPLCSYCANKLKDWLNRSDDKKIAKLTEERDGLKKVLMQSITDTLVSERFAMKQSGMFGQCCCDVTPFILSPKKG